MVRVTGTRRSRKIVHLHSPGSGACRVVTDFVVLLFPACGGVRREQALARLCTRRIPLRGALSKIAHIRHALYGRAHMHTHNVRSHKTTQNRTSHSRRHTHTRTHVLLTASNATHLYSLAHVTHGGARLPRACLCAVLGAAPQYRGRLVCKVLHRPAIALGPGWRRHAATDLPHARELLHAPCPR
jgi:hypothetical protein